MIDSKILRRRKGDRFIGLADIGSNTIHGVVYKVNNGDTTKILNHKDSTELISYICAGILSDDGIDRLCAEVKQLDVRIINLVHRCYLILNRLIVEREG